MRPEERQNDSQGILGELNQPEYWRIDVKKFSTEQIRNIGFFSHGGAGKTSLVESMVYDAGLSDRLGRVEDGTTVSDYDPDEAKRGMSIYASVAPVEWEGHKINILDAPGFIDFIAEIKSCLRVVEGAVMVVSAISAVEVGLERVWALADEQNLPRLVFVNKMDKENSDYYKALEALSGAFSARLVPLQLPIGTAESFKGIVDLMSLSAFTFDARGKKQKTEIPQEMADKLKEYREKLMESAAECDDSLMEKFFDSGELTLEEMKAGLKKGVRENRIVPVLCGSAVKNLGITPLMDLMLELIPSPADMAPAAGTDPKKNEPAERKPSSKEPFSALVFKTTADPYVGRLTLMRLYSGTLKADSIVWNPNKERDEKITALMIMRGKHQDTVPEVEAGDIVTVAKLQETVTGNTLCEKERPIVYPAIAFPEPVISMAVFPRSKGDEDKLSSGLFRLAEEDPTLVMKRDTETKETVLSGMGELHLEIVRDRLKRKFGVEVDLAVPKVPYKETIKSKIQIEHKHKKQSGGRGQYGHVWLEIEPLPRGQYFEFVDRVVGGVVPKNYIPAVEKGVREAMDDGIQAGYPVVDVRVTLYDGSYHTVDSSDMAFKIAGSMAFKKGTAEARPIIIEPIVNLEVVVPDQFMGDCIGDINGKRGRIQGMEPQSRGVQKIMAQVPLAEMLRYAVDLRSITQGRGAFSMNFSHYEEVPAQLAEHIVAASKKEE
jgi:elongation factor G